MYQLSEMIEIDRRFQNSVNLSIDLDNETKITGYIPTQSSSAILEHYLNNVKNNTEQATILIGPYGKGKSHLLLVLLNRLRKQTKPFLPVIVSGTYEDLNQAFLMGILDALKREGLEDAAPDSYYSKAVEAIELWKRDYPDAYGRFCDEIAKQNLKEEDYILQLKRLNEKVLRSFQKLYPQITSGSKFQPIVEMETTKIYQEINRVLYEKYQYSGMFIVFDEFSKYIEGHRPETFARDMKIVQDMCELSVSSRMPQMHITFVAHKSVKEYGTSLPREMRDTFTGVEGRLREIRFVVSSRNNYELIENVIQKKVPDFDKVLPSLQPYYNNAKESCYLPCFQSLFQSEDFEKMIVRGCYPLLPVTVYLLLAISERVAQNERSIFTFLANDEKGSLYRRVREQGEDIAESGVTADVVYDYFCSLFREETGLVHIHNEWLKADYALSKTKAAGEQKVIKVMALLLMLHRTEEAPVEERILALALGLSGEELHNIMENLIKKQMISWKPKSASYIFRNNVGLDLEKEIRETMAKLSGQLNLPEQLKELSELDYILPKRHNQENTISRYFEYVYMTQEQFLKLPDGEYLFEEHFSDGKLIAVIRSEDREEEILQKVHTLQDSRLIVLYPHACFEGEQLLRRYLAVKKLLRDKEFMEENRVLRLELDSNEEDIRYELNQILKRDYMPELRQCRVMHCESALEEDITFNGFLSNICDKRYCSTPKVNNELINRQHISAQNRRARKKIIEMILTEASAEKFETGTSPEATMYRATLLKTGIRGTGAIEEGCRKVLEEINRFIEKCGGNKISFAILYRRLMGKTYGARRGIIPIYIANELVKLQDTPVIYFGDREVDLEADIFDNINEHPDSYYLYVEHETVQKEEYLKQLEQLFCRDSDSVSKENRGRRLSRIVEGMHRWYRSLPQITVNFKVCPEDVEPETFQALTAFRKIFRQMELNPRDILFERIPDIISSADYAAISRQIIQIKDILDCHLSRIQNQAVGIVKAEFQAEETDSLKACLSQWYEKQSQMAKTLLSNSRVTGLLNYIGNLDTNDESRIISRIARIILDIYMEDWTDTSLEEFRRKLHETRLEIEHTRQDNEKNTGKNHLVFTDSQGRKVERFYEPLLEDSTSCFMQNAIEDVLDEFGDSLEPNQKVAVLMQALEKIIQ